jgi:cysteine desulfurase family protein (TIGR01976 family)
MTFIYDVNEIRKDFPACERTKNGVPVAYLDAPGGSQVPRVVTDAITDYLLNHNANEEALFDVSRETEKMYEEAREACADFLGCKPGELAFGYASTQNNFNLAFALIKQLKAGDEIIITDIDHRCNRSPWLALEDFGCVVKSVRVDPETQQVDLDDLKAKLSSKTKLAAFNWASNALGTVSDVKTMCKMAHGVGAITVVDAVHYAAHFPIDVKDIDTDVLVCSAYKFFGPHLGLMYIREALLDTLDFYNVQTEDLTGIRKTHMGTPPFELCCGAAAAVNWVASVGQKYAPCFEDELKDLTGRRRNMVAGMHAFALYEEPLATKMRNALRQMPGVRVYGPAEGQQRTSTIIFTIENHLPADICNELGEQGINTWDGNFYAVEVVDVVLGLGDQGGLVRIGLAAYNTEQDIDRTIEAIRVIAERQ